MERSSNTPLVNYARTRDGRLELAPCHDQHTAKRPPLGFYERGEMNWRRCYWRMVRQQERSKYGW